MDDNSLKDRFDSYFLAFSAENIKDINKIIEYLDAHNVKRIYV